MPDSPLNEPISRPLEPAKRPAPAQKIPKTALKKRALAVTVRHDVGKPLLYAPTGGRAPPGRLRDHPRPGRDPGGLHPSGNQRGLRNFFGVEIFRPEHRGPETWLPLAVADFSISPRGSLALRDEHVRSLRVWPGGRRVRREKTFSAALFRQRDRRRDSSIAAGFPLSEPLRNVGPGRLGWGVRADRGVQHAGSGP